MAEMNKEGGRGRMGYGSTYRKGGKGDLNVTSEIPAVLGGQVWVVKPEKHARAAHPCLWMQAGVVAFKNCTNFYDCTTCKYDLGMKKQVDKGKQISWQDAMRRRPDLERMCRHSLTNRIGNRICAYDYGCSNCDFDQFFEDVWSCKTEIPVGGVQKIKGFEMPRDYYFHNGHTWARIESGGNVRVGMDDFALKVLGNADALDLPLMGKELNQNEVGWGFKRQENHADVLAPVSGVITEVNAGIREKAGLANQSPYGNGWLFTVRSPNVKQTVKGLMVNTESVDWMESEVLKLEQMIETSEGPMATDGGHLNHDIYGNLPRLGWHNLTRTFLKTG